MLVVEHAVPPVVSDVNVFPSIVVVVAHASPLSPPGGVSQSRLCGHVAEGAIMIISVEVVCWTFSRREPLEPGAVDKKDVRPSIVVIIEDCHAGAGGLDDVLL